MDLGDDAWAIAALFLVSDTKPTISKAKDSGYMKDSQCIRFLDPKRANNIEIIINSRLKSPPAELAKAIMMMDDSMMNDEGILFA
jgi:hypothetical protein